jgi:hypothetical protein
VPNSRRSNARLLIESATRSERTLIGKTMKAISSLSRVPTSALTVLDSVWPKMPDITTGPHDQRYPCLSPGTKCIISLSKARITHAGTCCLRYSKVDQNVRTASHAQLSREYLSFRLRLTVTPLFSLPTDFCFKKAYIDSIFCLCGYGSWCLPRATGSGDTTLWRSLDQSSQR